MARFRLIPREERFFEDFVAMAEELRGGARLLKQMLAVDPPDASKADAIKDVEHVCDGRTRAIIRPGARRLTEIICDSTDRLVEALGALEKGTGVVELAARVDQLEREADRVHQDAIVALFDDERDPIVVIKWKELLDFLEAATDRCEDVANLLEGVMVKHG